MQSIRCDLLLHWYRGLSVSLLDTTARPAKTAEPIGVPFGAGTQVLNGIIDYVLWTGDVASWYHDCSYFCELQLYISLSVYCSFAVLVK